MHDKTGTSSQRPLVVSVHLPKTAGTSFAESLRQVYGERLHLAYEERPLHRRLMIRQARALGQGAVHALRGLSDDRIECVHGHFLPVSYKKVKARRKPTFVTWLRDPVARLQSHYRYWVQSYNADTAGSLHHRVVQENWSFERFALAPEMRNLYSAFLWRFPPSAFDFIGITEHYAEDLRMLESAVFKVPLKEAHSNVTRRASGSQVDVSPALRRKLEAFHSNDIALYEWALKRRQR